MKFRRMDYNSAMDDYGGSPPKLMLKFGPHCSGRESAEPLKMCFGGDSGALLTFSGGFLLSWGTGSIPQERAVMIKPTTHVLSLF